MRRKLQWCMALSLLPYVAGDNVIRCATGLGEGESRVISPEMINDGYCDCPLDGIDEPHTAACSGSIGWPGVSASVQQGALTYKCPEQKNFEIPLSRINDGICDCCDGSDEIPGTCTDICEVVLRKEREARQKLEKDFVVGYGKRLEQITAFKNVIGETEAAKEKVKVKLALSKQKLDRATTELDVLKKTLMNRRLGNCAALADSVAKLPSESDAPLALSGLFAPLTTGEISQFIIHSCQIAGELSTSKDKTCVPLRLAGLDFSLLWQKGKTAVRMVSEDDQKVLANIIESNAHLQYSDKNFEEPKKSKKPRRRLQEDDDFHGDFDEDYEYEGDEDEYMDDYYVSERYEPETYSHEDDNDGHGANGNSDPVQSISATRFSKFRTLFMRRSEEIREGIEKILKPPKKEGTEEEDEQQEQAAEKKVDPATYALVKSALKRRENTINRGYDFATSALDLLASLAELNDENNEQHRQDLLSLAVGTVVHGNLSTEHVWEILQAILPEYNESDQEVENAENTCASTWGASCPPRIIERSIGDSGAKAVVPPELILTAGESLCTRAMSETQATCTVDSEVDSEIPNSIPETYYGYSIPQPRSKEDFFEFLSGKWEKEFLQEVSDSKIEELEKSKDEAEAETNTIEQELEDLSEVVTGAQQGKFGVDGELYALKDSCFSIEAGKYVYEACLFGGAKQKEGAGHGTDLGKWSGSSFEKESGQRILKWTNGAKCWNGPKRSATLYVTCGAETKIISAEEPDTCRYVFEMESHIACDDVFKELHQL